MEWPPRSGRLASFPEIDRLKYFGLDDALVRILPAQLPLIAEALRISIRVEH
jgi:predicted NUDIX family NTP pyrophosphohydrolase